MSRDVFNDRGMIIKVGVEAINLNVMYLDETEFKNIRLGEEDTPAHIKQAIVNQETCYVGNMLVNFRNVKQALFIADGSAIRI